MCFVISACVCTLLSCKRYMLSMHSLLSMGILCNHITLMWYIFFPKSPLVPECYKFLCNTWCLQLVFSNCLPLEGGIGFCSCILSYHWWSLVPGPNMAAICSCPLPQMVPQDSLVKSHADVMHVVLWMIFISYLIQGRNCTNICSS